MLFSHGWRGNPTDKVRIDANEESLFFIRGIATPSVGLSVFLTFRTNTFDSRFAEGGIDFGLCLCRSGGEHFGETNPRSSRNHQSGSAHGFIGTANVVHIF